MVVHLNTGLKSTKEMLRNEILVSNQMDHCIDQFYIVFLVIMKYFSANIVVYFRDLPI